MREEDQKPGNEEDSRKVARIQGYGDGSRRESRDLSAMNFMFRAKVVVRQIVLRRHCTLENTSCKTSCKEKARDHAVNISRGGGVIHMQNEKKPFAARRARYFYDHCKRSLFWHIF